MKTKLIAFICIYLLSGYFFAVLIAETLPLKDDDDKEIQLLNRTKQMLSFMNESVDPCENFYDFTCGNWGNIYPAGKRNGHYETTFIKTINDAYEKKVIAMLSEKNVANDTNANNSSEFEQKVKNFFQSCLSMKNGVEPKSIIKLLDEFGKVPAIVANNVKQQQEVWPENEFNFVDTLARIKQKYGFEILIGLDVLPDLKDYSKNRIYIGEAEFELKDKAIYLSPMGASYRHLYRTTTAFKMRKIFDIDIHIALKAAEGLVNFEIELAKGLTDRRSDESLANLLINTTAEELQQKYGTTLDFKRFLKIIFGEVPEDSIYEYSPGYLQNVKEVIEKTKKEDVANYIYYHLASKFVIEPSKTNDELEKNCLDIVKKKFYKAVANMFYKRFVIDKQIEEDIQNIWHQIKATFKNKLQNIEEFDWIKNAETRTKAIEKLDAVKLQFNTFEHEDFEKNFENLTLDDVDFVGNLQNITEMEAKIMHRKLNEPISKIEVGEVNTAMYLRPENTIYFPVTMMQPYFLLASNFPDTLKFALTGFVLAHELIHAFDDDGRKFGKTGNLEDWWDIDTTERFLERRKCFMAQYHQYIYGSSQLPESELQSENIADNGGLKLAYDAYNLMQSNSNSSSNYNTSNTKHGLNDFHHYNDQQLFFIGYGQFWCSDIKQIIMNYKTLTDEHTPGKFRSIGTVSNSKEFAKAFKCDVSSKMNPEKKCKIY